MNFNHIIAAIWFAGALIWVATTVMNVRAGNAGLAALNVACVALFALNGSLFLMKA